MYCIDLRMCGNVVVPEDRVMGAAGDLPVPDYASPEGKLVIFNAFQRFVYRQSHVLFICHGHKRVNIIMYEQYNYKTGDIKMCSVGGPPDFDFDPSEFEKYKCKSCGDEFKGSGGHPKCPVCDSDDIEPVK